MLDTLHQILHWNIIQSNPALRTPRLQNSSYFKQKLWNGAENRERDWGETPKFFTLALTSQAQQACEARALRKLDSNTVNIDLFLDCSQSLIFSYHRYDRVLYPVRAAILVSYVPRPPPLPGKNYLNLLKFSFVNQATCRYRSIVRRMRALIECAHEGAEIVLPHVCDFTWVD